MPRRVPTPEDVAKKAEYTREWRKRNPEKLAAQIKRAAPKNYARIIGDPERAERQRTWCRDGNKKPRLRLIALLGGKCVECGHSDVRSLHVDHVRGTGAEERRMRGRNYYLHMIDNVASGDYQLLCACHNEIKRISEHEQVTSTAPRPRVLAPLADPKKIAQRALNRAAKARVYADPSLLAKKRERDRRDHARLRQRVIDALGGVCASCGWSDPRALHVDHVNGGGGKHRKAASSSNALYNQFIAEAHRRVSAPVCMLQPTEED